MFISGFSVMISPYEFSALSRQILMSVQPKPVRVMSTLTAQTVKVLTAVLVNRGLLEMEELVKVMFCLPKMRNPTTIHLPICMC